jgi:hypothetical protein
MDTTVTAPRAATHLDVRFVRTSRATSGAARAEARLRLERLLSLPEAGHVVVPNAVLASMDARHEDAARLVGAWERLERDHRIGFPDAAISQFGDPADAAREALGDEGFERAYEQGFSLDLDGIRRLVSAEGSLADEASGSSV